MKNWLKQDGHEPLSTIQQYFQCCLIPAHISITWELSETINDWTPSTRSIESETLGQETSTGIYFFNKGDSIVHQVEYDCFN